MYYICDIFYDKIKYKILQYSLHELVESNNKNIFCKKICVNYYSLLCFECTEIPFFHLPVKLIYSICRNLMQYLLPLINLMHEISCDIFTISPHNYLSPRQSDHLPFARSGLTWRLSLDDDDDDAVLVYGWINPGPTPSFKIHFDIASDKLVEIPLRSSVEN